MLHRDDLPYVEVGVELTQPCRLTGRVVASSLPGGRVATTVCRGSYDGLWSAHQGLVDWCRGHGRQLAGPRWEIYGPHRDDPAELCTTVYHLLS